jgi:excinuclease ABC subunit C
VPSPSLEFSSPFDPNSETDFSLFPATAAVFAIFPDESGAGSQPYLSSARDLRRRLGRLLRLRADASRRLNLRRIAHRIEYQPVGSSFEAQWHLFRLNKHYYPRHFRRRLRLRLPALIKVNLRNRFPRCYATAKMTADGSLYYGPFPSRAAADRFTGDFLDLYKIRRCTPDLDPDPSHPGCIYSQMKMCLAPCFKGCTDEEYRQELQRVLAFLESDGVSLVDELEAERDRASAQLEFEVAAHAHHRLDKARDVMRLKPPLVREVAHLNAVLVLPGSAEKSVTFFRVASGEIYGPAALSLQENVSSPIPLDAQIHRLLAPLGREQQVQNLIFRGNQDGGYSRLPPWEHLSLLARWYYSSFRVGEIVMLTTSEELPHARLVRLCRKVVGSRS